MALDVSQAGTVQFAPRGNLDIAASDTVEAGSVAAAGNVTINAVIGKIDNLTANDSARINADLAASGEIFAQNRVDIAGDSVDVSRLYSGGNTVIDGRQITIDQLLTGVERLADGTAVLSRDGDLTIRASSGNVIAGTIFSSGLLSIGAGNIDASSLSARGSIDIDGSIDVAGSIWSSNNVDLSGNTIRGANIASGVVFDSQGRATGARENASITLTADHGSVEAGTVDAYGSLQIDANQLVAGNVRARGGITIDAATDVSQDILSGADINLTGNSISAAKIISGLDFDRTATEGGSPRLAASGDLTIDATSGTVEIGSVLAAGVFDNRASSYVGLDVLANGSINIIGSADIGGQLLSASDVTVKGGRVTLGTAASGIGALAGGTKPANATGNMVIEATQDLSAGSLLSAGSMALSASGSVTAQATSHSSLKIEAGNSARLTGQTISAGDLTISASEISANDLIAGVDFSANNAGLRLGNVGQLRLQALYGAINAGGLTSAGELIANAAGNVSYASMTSFADASLSSSNGAISIDNQTRTVGNLSLAARNFDLSNNRAKIQSSGRLTMTGETATFAGSTYAFGGLDLNLSGNANLANAKLRFIDQPGVSGDLGLRAGTITTDASTAILAQRDIAFTVGDLDNRGQIAAGRDLRVDANNLTNRASGLVYSAADQKLYIRNALVNEQGAIMSERDLDIAAAADGSASQRVENLSGLIQAGRNIALNAAVFSNRRLVNPTWTTDNLVSSQTSGAFRLNAAVAARPFMHLFYGPNNDSQWLYQDLPRQNWDDYKDDLWSEVRLADGSSFRAWTWISSEGPTKSANILNWVRSHAPRDANGNLVIDPNNPSKIFVQQAESSKWDYATIFNFDENAYIRETVTEDRFVDGGSAQSMLRAGGNIALTAQQLSNSFSAIEAEGDISLRGQTLNNDGVALYRKTQTYCQAQGACEAYDAQGNRDASRDVASGTSTLTKMEVVGAASGTIKARGHLDIAGFKSINNSAVDGSVAGGASVGTASGSTDPLAGLGGITGGGALFTGNSALPGLNLADIVISSPGSANTGSEVGGQAGPAINAGGQNGSGSLADTLKTSGDALAAAAKPNSGGFGGTIPGQVFLFETRAEFLDVSKFYGSSYFISRIGYQPNSQIPFLGDAYFENQLIEQQLRRQTGYGLGNSFAPGKDAIQEMKLLLDNGIDYVKANNLSIGERLSDDQIAKLTQSIVVYEKRIVEGAEVLVPVVYLAAADKAQLTASGALLSGGSVLVQGDQIANSGAMVASAGMSVQGTDIISQGGSFISGDSLQLSATRDLTLNAQSFNIGGQEVVNTNLAISAGGNALISAGSALALKGVSGDIGGSASLSGNKVTIGAATVGEPGQENAVGSNVSAGGNLVISGDQGISVSGSDLSAGEALSLSAQNGSVDIGTVGVDRTVNDGYRTTTSTSQQGSKLSSGGSTAIVAGENIGVSGSTIDSGESVILKAEKDVTIGSAQDVASATYGRNKIETVRQQGSSITAGGSIIAEAGNANQSGDLTIIGSKLAADEKVDLRASGDLTITEARDAEVADLASKGRKYSTSSHIEQNQSVSSSISGGNGVALTSGQDTLISGSDLKAGNENQAADLSINAGRDLTIAAATDTVEMHEKSSAKGFLKKTNSSIDSYDETTIASNLSASGNVDLSAGRNAVVVGSGIEAGQNLAIEGDNVAILGGQESHSYDTAKKSSGLFVGSGGGFFSVWGKAQNESENSSTQNVASALKAGQDIDITARNGDVSVIGSDIAAERDLAIDASRDINVTPGAESFASREMEKRSGIGVSFKSGNGGFSIGVGYNAVKDETSQTGELNSASQLSAGRDASFNAGRDVNFQAANVEAERHLSIGALRDVNLLSALDQTNYARQHEELFAGISVSVSSKLFQAGEKAVSAAGGLGGKNGDYAIAPTALAASKTAQELKDVVGNKSPIASVNLSIGASTQKIEQSASSSAPVVTELRSGRSTAIVAEQGSINGNGVQINTGISSDGIPIDLNVPSAGNVLLSAGQNINLQSVEASSTSNSSSKSFSAGVGIGLDLGLNGSVSVGPKFDAAATSGNSATSYTQQVNSHVNGTGRVAISSGNDTNLNGAVISGESVIVDVGGDLNIESRQDTARYDEKTTGVSVGISSGAVASGSKGTIKGDFANVAESSGIVAGSGGYHVNVEGGVDLKGGVIASTADKEKNFLSADHLTYSDIENRSESSTSSMGISVGIGADGKLGLPTPSVGQPANDEDAGSARATVTPGNLALANQSQDLVGLNTDLSKANSTVDMFDIERLKAKQESAAALSELLNTAVGDISKSFGFEEGSPEKIALHTAVGAITAMVAGGDVALGALAGGGQELIGAIVSKALMDNPNLTQEQRNALGQWTATLVGAAIGGNQGAAAALDAEKFNRQLHIAEGELIRANAARFAVQQGYCVSVSTCSAEATARAEAELTMEALRRVDSLFADINLSSAATNFLDELAESSSPNLPGGQSPFSATPEQYSNHVMNIEYLFQNKDLYEKFGNQNESKYYTAYVHALLSAANDTEDMRNATPAQTSAVLNGLKDAIHVIEKGQASSTGFGNTISGAEKTYINLLDGMINAVTVAAGANNSALQQFITENHALVDGLMSNVAFEAKVGKLIQVEYLLAVAGPAAASMTAELAAACRLGSQVCLTQINMLFQELVALMPELGGTGVGLSALTALDRAAIEQAALKVDIKILSQKVWSLNPIERGISIEKSLAQTEYSLANGWYNIGATKGGYFPLIDFQGGNTVISLKTVDTTGSTWMSRMERTIDELRDSGITVNGITPNKVLDIRVQPGGAEAAQALQLYGERNGVTVIVKEYP
ncbi:hemagglutinin repeat-containing protein [Neorhizobium sp. JUb45]|uniref:hemagglutinin repeat-containing protein n=1 Tax=Neorhizobium sp. JUb45 TaxID=2485113 RepID=UPI001FE16F25|nr:hemagglutinin repeat-containing protein [Neorhizobium sp. JUb45]